MNSLSKSKYSLISSESRKRLFGCDLDELQMFYTDFVLPLFIEKSLIFLSQKGVNSIGIFRKSGVKSRIQTLKEEVEEGIDIDFSTVCVYDIADVVKLWFREIVDQKTNKTKQLITQQIISSFKQNKKEFTLCMVPDTQRAILQIILRFLALIANNSKVNQMNCHNLAICWTPSLCECDGDQQLFDAQKCLEFCINNCEILFLVSLNAYSLLTTLEDISLPRKHEATAVIDCGPNDILNRILYERHLIDVTIIEWSIGDETTQMSDTFIVRLQTSAFLPIKTMIIKRNWRINSLNNIEVIESGYLYESRWSLTANGEGRTLVAHMIATDLRGHSYDWYNTTFLAIHNNQLHRLSQSFLVNTNEIQVSVI
ncbi:stAR-related lipid transfer protein 13-like [Oppia nitens]|uniref:stAR-related lipid transfer protein 13-like n=1 Tax=Oppia nitens TaxID=1686743 RepID=UPI0023DC9F47|nr:stAR-related lipid transfer protein 13-like [Oppia nitens]